jgi:hypothetical protein
MGAPVGVNGPAVQVTVVVVAALAMTKLPAATPVMLL